MDRIFVGIPTLNGPERLAQCIESLYKTHDMYKKNQYDIRLLILDDCSTKANLEANKDICAKYGLNLLMHTTRSGVAAGWNDLVRHYASDYCILLNDDIFVAHNWIDCVVYTLKHNPDIGVVGLNAYEGDYSVLPSNNVPTYVESKILLGGTRTPILSARGYAFGFRKSDYIAVGGFSNQYFCFFEEIDFNFKMMTMLNKRNCILSHPILKHTHGATTFKELLDPTAIFNESKTAFEKNWQMKWPEELRVKFAYKDIPQINVNDLNEWNSNINCWG